MSETMLLSEYLTRKDFSGYGTLADEAKRIWDLEQVLNETSNDEEREDEYDEAYEKCDDLCREVRHKFLYDGVRTIDAFGECVCDSARNGLEVIDISDYLCAELTVDWLEELGVGRVTVSIHDKSMHELVCEFCRRGWVMESPCEIEKDGEDVAAYQFVKRGK